MALRWVLQHLGTAQFISSHPGLAAGYSTSPTEAEAVSFSTRREAELYRADFKEFAGGWTVQAIERASIEDDEAAMNETENVGIARHYEGCGPLAQTQRQSVDSAVDRHGALVESAMCGAAGSATKARRGAASRRYLRDFATFAARWDV